MRLLPKAITAPLGKLADKAASTVGVRKTDLLNFIVPGAGVVASGVDTARHGDGFMKGAMGSVGNTAKLAGFAAGGSTLAPHVAPAMDKLGALVKGVGGSAVGALKRGMTTDKGGFDWGKLGKIATVGAGMVGQQQQRNDAKNYMAGEQARRDQFMQMAMENQKAQQPFRDLALRKLSETGSNNVYKNYMRG